MFPLPPGSPLFPYTTLFRSAGEILCARAHGRVVAEHARVAVADRQVEQVVGAEEHTSTEGSTSGARRSPRRLPRDRKSTRLNSSHVSTSYAVFCLKKKTNTK